MCIEFLVEQLKQALFSPVVEPAVCLLVKAARAADGTGEPDLPVGRLLVEHVELASTHLYVHDSFRIVRVLKDRALRLLYLQLQLLYSKAISPLLT